MQFLPPGVVVCENANIFEVLRRLRGNWSTQITVEWMRHVDMGLFGVILLSLHRFMHVIVCEIPRDLQAGVGVPVQIVRGSWVQVTHAFVPDVR